MLICTPLSDKIQINNLRTQPDIQSSDHFFMITENADRAVVMTIRPTSQYAAKLISNDIVWSEADLVNALQIELNKLGIQQLKIAEKSYPITTCSDDKIDWRNELNETWHNTIPLSKAMNIEASYYNQSLLTVTADKAFNQNLHNTMFAGSIYTHATLTGWGWVFMQLKAAKVNGSIVLADADIKYHRPITGEPLAQTHTVENDIDLSPLTSAKKVSANVRVKVFNGATVAATFSGRYVILPANKS